MPFEKTCPQCQQKFVTQHSTQTYCSRICRGAASRASVSLICQQCGKPFATHPSRVINGAKYCGTECFHVAHAIQMKENPPNQRVEHVVRTCEECGKVFTIPPSRMNRTDMAQGRFCSLECNYAHKASIRGENHPLYKPASHICEWCGKEYRTKPVYVRNGTTHFCSRQCQGAHTSKYSSRKRTIIEIAIRDLLTAMGLSFDAEAPLGYYVCDFLLPAHKLVIECDGGYWHSLPVVVRRDHLKDKWLNGHGYTILRLPESIIRSDLDECRRRIIAALPLPLALGAAENSGSPGALAGT